MRYMRLGLSQVRICRPPPLSFAPIFMKDVHSAESNEKYIFRYLFFELWLIVFTIYGSPRFSSVSPTEKKIVQKWSNLQKRCAMC